MNGAGKITVGNRKPVPTGLGLLIALLAILILLVFVAMLAVHIPAVQERTVQWALKKIDHATSYKVHMDSYRWSQFTGVSVRGLRVTSAGETILECEEGRLSYSFSFRYPYVQPEELFLMRPLLRLEKDSSGRWRFAGGANEGARPSRASRGVPAFAWPRLRIESGFISGRQDGETVLEIRSVSGTIMPNAIPGVNGPVLKFDFGK